MACKYDAKDFKKFFKSFGRQLNDYTAGLSMLAKEDALRSIRLRLINKDTDMSVIIDGVLLDEFPEIAGTNIREPDVPHEELLHSRDILKIERGAADFSTMVSRIDDVRDLMDNPVGEHVELRGSNQFAKQFSELGLESFDDLYSAYTGQVHSPQELAEIYNKIRKSKHFEEFLGWIDNKYEILESKTDKLSKEERQRGVHAFYNIYNNSIKRSSRLEMVVSNIDPTYKIEDYDKQIGLAALNKDGKKSINYKIIRKKDYDLKNKSKLGEWVAKNFIEASDAKIRGHAINKQGMTGYFNLSQSGTIIPYNQIPGKDGVVKSTDWFFKSLGLDVTEKQLSSWEYQLLTQKTRKGNALPMVLVMPTPGDSATFMTTRIIDAQVNELFPKQAILDKLKDTNPNYFKEISELGDEESILNWYQSKQSIYETSERQVKTISKDGITLAQKQYGENWKGRWKKIETSFLQLQNVITVIGQNNFKQYVNNQFKKELITDKQQKMMIDSASLKLRAKTKANQAGTIYRRSSSVAHISSLVARHEWLQAIRGNDYMLHENGNIYHAGTRLKLNKSMGITSEGSGEARRLLYDHERVKVEYTDPETGETKEINHITDVLGGTNRNDGASFYSTQRLELMNNRLGSYPLKENEFWPKEMKSVVSERFEDDKGNWTGYFELKHAGFEMPAGLKVFDLNDNLLFETRKEMNKVKIYNADGESLDAVHDLDAAKTYSGKLLDVRRKNKNGNYIKTATTFWTKENSERIISMPKYGYNKTVFGLMSYMKELNYTFKNESDQKDFDAFKNAFVDMSLNQSDIYIDALIEADEDPEKMRKLLDYVYENMVGKNDSFRDKLDNTRGMGIHHPDFLIQARSILTNMLLGRGMMKLHTHTDKIIPRPELMDKRIYGSDYVMAPDFTEEVKDVDHVILSADNKVIYNQIVLKILMDPSIGKAFQKVIRSELIKYGELTHIKNFELGLKPMIVDLDNKTHQKILNSDIALDAVNEFLEKHSQKVLTYRPPITHISAVQVKTIQKFVEGAGNGIYHHPKDVFVRLTGDHDIDHAGAILIPEKYSKPIESFQKTKWYENMASINANLGMFEVEENVNIADLNAVRNAWQMTIKGVGIQGKAMNMKSISATLASRFNRIEFSDGVVVRPKKSTDIVVMDYAPLNYKKAKEMDKRGELPFGATIIFDDKSENYYLKTTVAHEQLLIANAATDYANKKLRGMMLNKWGLLKDDWFIDRVYHVDKGALRQPHYTLLARLRDKYKYSLLKQLRNKENRRKMNFGSVFNELQDLHDDLAQSKDRQAEKLLPMLEFNPNKGEKAYLTVVDIDVNKVVTPEESILINPIKWINKEFRMEEGNSYPLFYPKDRYEITHHLTKETLRRKYFYDERNWNAEQVKAGYELGLEYSNRFYELTEELENLTNQESIEPSNENALEEFMKTKKPEYDEKLHEFNSDFILSLNQAVDKYGTEVRDIFTLHVMAGMGKRKNIMYLPVLKVGNQFLMSPEIHREYMELWENTFFDADAVKAWEDNVHALRSKSKLPTFEEWLNYQDIKEKGEC